MPTASYEAPVKFSKGPNGYDIMYRYNRSGGGYSPSSPTHFTWKTCALFAQSDSCIRFENTSKAAVKVASISLKVCSCNSDGEGFWSSSGYMSPVYGIDRNKYPNAKFVVFVRNNTTGESSNQESGRLAQSRYNMDTPGSSQSATGDFGVLTRYKENGEIDYDSMWEPAKLFEIEDSPIINPGDEAYIHLRVNGCSDNSEAVKFLLNSDDMDIPFTSTESDYFWQYFNGSHKKGAGWHLTHSVEIFGQYEGEGWAPIEGKRP